MVRGLSHSVRIDGRRDAQRGMTLIEIVVAVAAMSLLGTLAYGVLMTTIRTQEDAQTIQERYHAGRIAIERMKRELTMAFVSLHQAEDQRTQTLFEGERSRLVFNTAAHEPLKRNARQSDQLEVEYALKSVRGRDGYQTDALIRRVKFHIDDRPGDGGREEVLVEGVRKLEFEYFDEFREDWTNDWEVRVDDAEEMRDSLKQVQEMRDKIDDLRNAEPATTGIAGLAGAAKDVATASAADEIVDEAELELLDGLVLPARVRVKMVLVDRDDSEYLIESQVEIPMTDPLWY